MTRKILALLFIALAYSVSAWAQPQPIRVTPIDPAGTAVYPFGTIAVGTSSSGVRVGPFGCYVTTSNPTYTTGQIHPCSLTTSGELRITGPVTQSGAWSVTATVPGGLVATVDNLAPSSSAAFALSTCPVVSAATNNSTNCATAVANLFGFELYNTTTTVYYLRLYNTASAPTCSSATGFIRSIPIPPAASAGQVGGLIRPAVAPTNFATGLSYCITAGSSSTDNTSAAVGILGVLLYK